MKKFFIATIVACLLVLPLSGCNQKTDDNVIRLNEVTHSVFYAPLYVAMENGYFKEQGLDVKLTTGQGANNSMSALISDQADIGLMGVEASIYVANEGRDNYPVVFGQLTNCDGSFIMSRTKEPDFKLENMIGKEILGGRKGGVPAMSLEHALRKADVFDKVRFNDTIQFDVMVGAFVGGTGDYCTVFEPTASMLEKEGSAYVVGAVGEYSGNMPFTAFMCNKDYLKGKPDKVEKFMKAIVKAIDFVMSSDEATVANAVKNQFPTTDLDILASSIKRYKEIGAYRSTPVMEKADFEHLQDIIIEAGIMTKRADFSKIVDNSIAEKVMKG